MKNLIRFLMKIGCDKTSGSDTVVPNIGVDSRAATTLAVIGTFSSFCKADCCAFALLLIGLLHVVGV